MYRGFDSTTTTLSASEFPGLSAIWVFVTGYYEDPQASTRYDDFFYFVGNEALNRGGGGVGYVSNLDFFLLGAIGKAYLVSDNRIDLYEIIEGSNEGFFSLRITQKEVDKALAAAGEATCVKASVNDRASVTVWAGWQRDAIDRPRLRDEDLPRAVGGWSGRADHRPFDDLRPAGGRALRGLMNDCCRWARTAEGEYPVTVCDLTHRLVY